jgi:hypothetical protein
LSGLVLRFADIPGSTLKREHMKTFFAGILLIAFIGSCKKNGAAICEQNMAGIAGKYKITRLEHVSYNTGAAQDATSTLTSCELSGTYTLRADGNATFAESINCNGSGNGTWDLSGGHFYISLNAGDGNQIGLTSVVSWDCTDLVLITQFPSVDSNYRFTLTRF